MTECKTCGWINLPGKMKCPHYVEESLIESEEEEISFKESVRSFKNYIIKESGNKDNGRFKVFANGYKVDRWIGKVAMLLIFAFLFIVAYSNNFQMDYFSCQEPGTDWGCENPFYKEPSWKNQPYLPAGEYGFDYRNDWAFNNLGTVIFGILGLGVLSNHLIYNKKRGKHETKN